MIDLRAFDTPLLSIKVVGFLTFLPLSPFVLPYSLAATFANEPEMESFPLKKLDLFVFCLLILALLPETWLPVKLTPSRVVCSFVRLGESMPVWRLSVKLSVKIDFLNLIDFDFLCFYGVDEEKSRP